jgi:hypothetical protein
VFADTEEVTGSNPVAPTNKTLTSVSAGQIAVRGPLLPSWVPAQKAAADRQVIAVTRQRLAAGEEVARM